MNKDITQDQITEARDWASDCLGMVAETVTINRALKYITAQYPGGWDAFVAEVCVDALVPAVPAPVVPLGDWRRNPDAFDPSAIMRTVEADGTLYTLHSVMGEGWPVCIRKTGYGHVGMADWNDMAGVRRAIDTHNAKQA